MCGRGLLGGVGKQWTKAIRCGACYYSIVLQVWPIPTLMPLESKRRQNTLNNTDWNVSCYCNSKLPKTYTWSGTFILKDGRYTLTFFRAFFLSCKANARVKLAKTGHGLHSSTLVVICVVWLLFVLFCVLFVCKCVLPPGDNPIAVNKCIISYI
jgi:hypothetical protein